ncbi:MAG: tripartite tricarboxylate transporter substrate binding protein [Burkholderiales bacterium]|nr:MAG: tripartite tricarboxylate transporter substrate binding protein [Burkholderiales bacterium]
MNRRQISIALGSLLAGSGWQQAQAQGAAGYPNKPITLVASFSGMTDQMGRVLGDAINAKTGKSVVVDTKAGASGIIAAEYVLKQPADGYVLFHTTNSTHAANQSLFKTLPYDYVRDFIPVTGVLRGSLMMVVSTTSPAKSIADLTELARKQAGKLSYGYGATAGRVAVELYSQIAKLEVVSVPYKTNGQAVVDLIGGRLDFMALDALTAGPQIASGRMRALAITGDKRMPGFPNVPTMQEPGIPDYSLTFWQGIYAPRGTPDAVVKQAAVLLKDAINSPQAQKFMATVSVDPFPISGDELMKFQQAEAVKWRAIVSAAGIQPE